MRHDAGPEAVDRFAADVLRRARRQAALSQRELAARASTSQAAIAAYEEENVNRRWRC